MTMQITWFCAGDEDGSTSEGRDVAGLGVAGSIKVSW
jgi:hypothetical protein